jgi:hypothetical protein
VSRARLDERPVKGKLTIPYMVDARRHPVDFKAVDPEHVDRCAKHRRCGVCDGKIRSGPIAFIGAPDSAHRQCFADPWMHEDCGRLAMQQCPFLAARKGWRELDSESAPLIAHHAFSMALFLSPDCRSHKDQLGVWHFEAVGELMRAVV